MRKGNILTSKMALITYLLISILLIIVIATFLPANDNINNFLKKINLPGLGANSTNFITSVFANTFTALVSILFFKLILNKKYSSAHVEFFSSTLHDKYDLQNILDNKSIKNLFISDQNLHSITQSQTAIEKDYKSKIFKLLKNGTNIYLLLCDLENKEAIKTWERISGNKYENHLKESIRLLKEWRNEYDNLDKDKKGIFLILKAPFVSLNIIAFNYLDPSTEGKIIIVPYFYSPDYDDRPIFILDNKNNYESFKNYRSKIIQITGKGYDGIEELK